MDQIAVLPGDGIGPEVMEQTLNVLDAVQQRFGFQLATTPADAGGIAIDRHGQALPDDTLRLCEASDAILFGSVGGPKWEPLDIAVRPEKGLLGMRKELGLFANLRPAILYPQLAGASTLKPEVVSGLDLMIVRELTGGIYFGQPRGIRTGENGQRTGFNTLVYSEAEIERIIRETDPPRPSTRTISKKRR